MIAIIDYGMGNLGSVRNAFGAVGADAAIVSRPAELDRAMAIVLPGVGAFGDAMSNLEARGWCEALERRVRGSGMPFLGICLGLQVLASVGFENGRRPGLGWIEGEAVRLNPSEAKCRLPHVGWNDAHIVRPEGIWKAIEADTPFYFVHSYHLVPTDQSVVAATSNYGGEFVCALRRDNIEGVQFHPEKSHTAGLALLKTFAESVLRC